MLNGATGVDKVKIVDGKTVELLRFICILVPINSYLRKLKGDSNLLPFLPQMTLMTLEPNEVLFTDSEDMMSCFNLFKMPDCWAGYFAFEKPVPRSAFGGNPNELGYVYMRAVPMGWLGAVDVMQSMARRLVFNTCSVPTEAEMRKDTLVTLSFSDPGSACRVQARFFSSRLSFSTHLYWRLLARQLPPQH